MKTEARKGLATRPGNQDLGLETSSRQFGQIQLQKPNALWVVSASLSLPPPTPISSTPLGSQVLCGFV